MSNHEQDYLFHCRPFGSDVINIPERPKEIEEILRRLSKVEKKLEKLAIYASTPARERQS